jgi:hypothetical protein
MNAQEEYAHVAGTTAERDRSKTQIWMDEYARKN